MTGKKMREGGRRERRDEGRSEFGFERGREGRGERGKTHSTASTSKDRT